jgi:hypothetical protein
MESTLPTDDENFHCQNERPFTGQVFRNQNKHINKIGALLSGDSSEEWKRLSQRVKSHIEHKIGN